MTSPKRSLLGAVIVLTVACAGSAASSSPATSTIAPSSATLKTLRPADASAYATAFAAVRRGDFEQADRAVATVQDKCLVGRVVYEKLMSLGYTATFAELKAWLVKYHDLPDADRVWTVAKKRQIASEAPPPPPDVTPAPDDAQTWARVERVAQRLEAPPRPKTQVSKSVQAAREAYYAGDVANALKLAKAAGEHWIYGLAAYRTNKFEEAASAFSKLSQDRTQNEWVRSAAAFWSARSEIAAGRPEQAPALLSVAAATPYTFYGLIAERQLGLNPSVSPSGVDIPDEERSESPFSPQAPSKAGETALTRLVRGDRRAHRAAAFAQIGLLPEAGLELRTALLGAGGELERKKWLAAAIALGAPLTSPADLGRGRRRFDLSSFQTPDFFPIGGYTLSRALVYALIKQESRFNPNASSTAGAYGLMQLTPATAAHVTQDAGLVKDPSALKDPALNLRIGQDYVGKLLDATKGDLLHAVAAYNSGPSTILKTASQMPGADSLLVFESMPGGQTREYVQRVIANYWIYRLMLGQPSPTLDAAAAGARTIRAILDGD